MNSNKGFTLVELLIVVSIIGILSTIGIPTFKKMVQKSRKSEARVLLGGLYTAEAAFFSEYGAYGSQIDKLGFEIDGGAKFYSVGFPDAACASIPDAPAIATPVGTAINSTFPAYYSTNPGGVLISVFAKAGQTECQPGIVPADGATFTATASGVISSLPITSPITDQDVWTINDQRAMVNTLDGVK